MPVTSQPHTAGPVTPAFEGLYLAAAVPPLLPGVTFHRDPTPPADTVPLQAYPYRVFDPARPNETTPPGISASAVVTDEQGIGDIGFSVSSAYQTAAAGSRKLRGPALLGA